MTAKIANHLVCACITCSIACSAFHSASRSSCRLVLFFAFANPAASLYARLARSASPQLVEIAASVAQRWPACRSDVRWFGLYPYVVQNLSVDIGADTALLRSADVVYFFAGGKSVQLPCATSAAMPMLSPSVGWGWMVLPMSTASAICFIVLFLSPSAIAAHRAARAATRCACP